MNVLVIGDSCQDVFCYCECDRLAPEAPVPVLDYKYEQKSPGMAYNAYRNIKSLGVDIVEMKRSKRKSFCCGAGGAQMFKEAEKGSAEINIVRTQEALDTKSKIIVTGCPFCNTMMSDGVKNINEGAALVKDIAEVVAESLI